MNSNKVQHLGSGALKNPKEQESYQESPIWQH
jgi:hypothetical protein